MRFKYKLPLFVKIVLIFLIVAISLTILYFFAKIFNWFGLVATLNMGLEISSIVLSFIMLAFTICMLNINYKVTPNCVYMSFCGYDILNKKVKTSNILNIVLHKEEQHLYLSYLYQDGQEPTIMLINISSKQFEKFVATLKSFNNKIIYTEE